MPKLRNKATPEVTAENIWRERDGIICESAITSILNKGGAIMIGQTRDNSKLIVTVFLDGDNDKEYCEDVKDLNEFLGAYQI